MECWNDGTMGFERMEKWEIGGRIFLLLSFLPVFHHSKPRRYANFVEIPRRLNM